ncbi:hypothetical protein L0V05_06495 [Tabrizicola sp. J26]|uniref:hypothetical protein n=1 Tax=Alitabrizicola rongguiensis TaxID=2909234 RepID=UPI001F30521D|nr:hypothetical protein [Tabrizicola rongguiensis]MCF1708462.1 hypothetical protein [Tabrizicola rongguiensis]
MNRALRIVAVALANLCAGPAAAECVTAENLTGRGILFTMADGKVWLARDAGKKGVRLDQANGKPADDAYIEGPYGIYEVVHGHRVYPKRDFWGYIKRDFRKRPPQPVAGERWSSKLEEDQGSFFAQSRGSDFKGEVSYRFLPEKTVKISGCAYQIVPVEATFTGKDTIWDDPVLDRNDRWIYFPALGVGVHTMSRDGYRQQEWKAGITGISVAK